MSSNTQFLDRARQIAGDYEGISPEDMYVVWFCKTLQNWKALVSTDERSGRYYEVTHNGNKGETYLDVYVKFRNAAIPDAEVSE